MQTVHTRVFECPKCGCVAMGYGPMGETRDFTCLNTNCDFTKTDNEKRGTYIEREIESDIQYTEVDGPKPSHGVPSHVEYEKFLQDYTNS